MSAAISRKSTTMWNLVFHYVATILTFVSGVVLVPLYLRTIPVDVYGYWLATGNIIAWISVIDPGLSTIAQQRVGFHLGKGEYKTISSTITVTLILSAIMGLVIIVVGGILWFFLGNLLDPAQVSDWDTVRTAFIVSALGGAFMVASYGITAINQGLQSSIGPGLIHNGVFAAGLIFTVVGLLRGHGLATLAWATVFRGGAMLVVSLAFMLWRTRKLGIRPIGDLSSFREMLSLGGVSFLGRIPVLVGSNIESFVAARFVGAEFAPVLSMTRKVMDVCRLFAERPALAFVPSVAHLAGSGEYEKLGGVMRRLFGYCFWALGLLFAGFAALNHEFITLWVGAKFFAGDWINLAYCAGMVVAVTIASFTNLCYALGNIRGNSLASLALGLASIALQFAAGFAGWGGLGIALAPLVANIVVGFGYYPGRFAKLAHLPPGTVGAMFNEGLRVAACAAVAGAAFWFLSPSNWVQFAVCGAGLGLTYGVLLLALSPLLRGEFSAVALPKIRRFLP